MIDLRVTAGGRPVTEAEATDTLADVMERTGTHPAFVHAIRVCGFLVTEDNEQQWDVEDVERWDDAVDEWFDLHPDDTTPI